MTRKQGVNETRSLRARLRAMYRYVSAQSCRIELQSGREMMIEGCCGIEEYHADRIVLTVRDPVLHSIHICGRELRCSSYHPDGVVVKGKILCVQLCGEKQLMVE
jgi:hypothetical protein